MHLHQGIYLDFCYSLEIYYFTLDLLPHCACHGWRFIFHPSPHLLSNGRSQLHCAAKPSPTPCRRVRAEKCWGDPNQNLPSDAMGAVGSGRFPSRGPKALGLLALNEQPRHCLIGEKIATDWIKRGVVHSLQVAVRCWVPSMLG